MVFGVELARPRLVQRGASPWLARWKQRFALPFNWCSPRQCRTLVLLIITRPFAVLPLTNTRITILALVFAPPLGLPAWQRCTRCLSPSHVRSTASPEEALLPHGSLPTGVPCSGFSQ
jgi:hypothetical protein